MENFPRSKEYLGKKILAIDYGTKVTGLASFQPGNDPYPLQAGRIIYRNDDQLIKEISEFVDNEMIDIIILGIPYLLDRGETDATVKIKKFGKRLENHFNNKLVFFQDETLSTNEAKSRMKSDPRYNFKVDLKAIDMLSACIILEDFIMDTSK